LEPAPPQLALPGLEALEPPTLGDLALEAVSSRFERIVSREDAVREGNDPEALHQMRVASRRLRSALDLLAPALQLPVPLLERGVRRLTRALGRVRDLEVQTADLDHRYRHTRGAGSPLVQQMIRERQRRHSRARRTLLRVLSSQRYRELKAALREWIASPGFTPMGGLPLATVLPDLLAAALADLLLHPAWTLSGTAFRSAESVQFHDLRKTIKRIRYQAECLSAWYGPDFKAWIEELRVLQERLGTLQDGAVLLSDLKEKPPEARGVKELAAAIRRRQLEAMADWKQYREKYLSEPGRADLRTLIAQPVISAAGAASAGAVGGEAC
jgi:CHAD domain-containing protein